MLRWVGLAKMYIILQDWEAKSLWFFVATPSKIRLKTIYHDLPLFYHSTQIISTRFFGGLFSHFCSKTLRIFGSGPGGSPRLISARRVGGNSRPGTGSSTHVSRRALAETMAFQDVMRSFFTRFVAGNTWFPELGGPPDGWFIVEHTTKIWMLWGYPLLQETSKWFFQMVTTCYKWGYHSINGLIADL